MERFSTLFIAILVGFSFAAQAGSQESDRVYLISQKNLKVSQSRLSPKIIETHPEHALVRLTSDEVVKLSAHFHEELNVCGGYIDVTEELKASKKDLKTFLADQATVPVASFDKVEPTFPTQVKTALAKFDKTRYWNFLTQLSSFPDRSATSQEGVKAAKFLGDHLLKIATDLGRTEVTVRYFQTGGSYIQPSTLVKVAGKNPSLPGVLIGGHMDTFANQKPGADDDASGSSTVVENFRSLMASGLKFDRDMYFAFYAAEERGLVGSGVMARAFVSEGIKLRGVLQFDMTGFKSPNDAFKIYFINDNVDPSMTNFLKKLTVTYVGIPSNQIGDDRCGYACSDHAQWQRSGYPAGFPLEASFANYNKAIHTTGDAMSLLDVEHSSQFAKLGIAFVVEAADPAK